MKFTGNCHCGSISIEANIDLSKVYACHCTDCQIFSGGPFRVMVTVDKSDVEISGSLKEYLKIADSGNKRIQAFCNNCCTSLYSAPQSKDKFSIRTGVFHNSEKLEPIKHLYGNSSVKWIKDIYKKDWVETMPKSNFFKPK